jgi:hypothetical protein
MPYADIEQGRERKRLYQKTEAGKAAHAAAVVVWRKRNANRLAAHNAINKAILRGKIEKPAVCFMPDCNCSVVEAHHPCYDMPLDVVWLCPPHHKQAHALVKE